MVDTVVHLVSPADIAGGSRHTSNTRTYLKIV
jgi:hypothetical protein